jgi:transcriptional regulator with XRE-family HTH domain
MVSGAEAEHLDELGDELRRRLGRELRRVREAAEVPRRAVRALAGVTARTIERIEAGQSYPRPRTLAAYESLCGVVVLVGRRQEQG